MLFFFKILAAQNFKEKEWEIGVVCENKDILAKKQDLFSEKWDKISNFSIKYKRLI